MRRSLVSAAVSALVLVLVLVPACGGAERDGASPVVPLVAAPAADAGGGAPDATLGDASATTGGDVGAGRDGGDGGGGVVPEFAGSGVTACGCSLCQPVVSDDPCTTDADCAPSSPCHADKCVGVAHAAPRAHGMMCTQIMMCQTTDANACACYQGKCALVPRARTSSALPAAPDGGTTASTPVTAPPGATTRTNRRVLSVTLTPRRTTLIDGAVAAGDADVLRLARAAAAADPHVRAVLVADASITYGAVVHVMDLLKQAGVNDLAFATSPKGGDAGAAPAAVP